MDPQKLIDYIKKTGYRTSSEIDTSFHDTNAEILNMTKIFLVEKGHVRKISFESPSGKEDLYYLPS